MRQQAYPHIQFCSHPIHYFNYLIDERFCLILDLHAMISFQRILKTEQRTSGSHEVSLDIGLNEVIIGDNIDGLQPNFCFTSYKQFCSALNMLNPFRDI